MLLKVNLYFSSISVHYFSLRYAEQLAAIPRFARLSPLFKSSAPVELTEAETEYMVRCVKHTFLNYIVLQFDCTNTLNDQLLEGVNVVVEGEGWEVETSIPCPSLPYSQMGSCYSLLPIPQDIMATTGKSFYQLSLYCSSDGIFCRSSSAQVVFEMMKVF